MKFVKEQIYNGKYERVPEKSQSALEAFKMLLKFQINTLTSRKPHKL